MNTIVTDELYGYAVNHYRALHRIPEVGFDLPETSAYVVKALEELGIAPSEAVAIGGGAKSDLWRQILADMLKMPLTTVENVDSSLGSAMMAGVAVGVFASHEEAVQRCVRVTGVTMPDPEGAAFYDEQFKLYKQIQQALAPIYHQL